MHREALPAKCSNSDTGRNRLAIGVGKYLRQDVTDTNVLSHDRDLVNQEVC